MKGIFYGGQQEHGIRPGTIPVALVAALGYACRLAEKEYKNNQEKCVEIKKRLVEILNNSDLYYEFNGKQEYCIPLSLIHIFPNNTQEEGKIDTDIGMKILFGTNLQNGENVLWEPNNTDVLFHTNTGIIGTMGTGKTQFTKSLITQLYQSQKLNVGDEELGILIFDYKGDYNESKRDFVEATNAKVYKPYALPINPLAIIETSVFKPLLPVHTANTFRAVSYTHLSSS